MPSHRSASDFPRKGRGEKVQEKHKIRWRCHQGARSEQNAGTVPAFFLFTIDGSAPGVSCLVLRLGELRAFAVKSDSQRFSRRYCRTPRPAISTPSLDTQRGQKLLAIEGYPTYSTQHSFRTLASRLCIKGSPVIFIEEVVRHLFDLVQLGPDNSDVVLTHQ